MAPVGDALVLDMAQINCPAFYQRLLRFVTAKR